MATGDGKLRAIKVEHPALDQPHYWLLPEGRKERDELIHGTVMPWLRARIGESEELATFTAVEDDSTLPQRVEEDD